MKIADTPQSGVIAIQLSGVDRAYETTRGPLYVLKDAELTIRAGEMVGLVAPSGAGKSTLLHTAGLLERPDAGRVMIGGQDCGTMDDGMRTAMRRKSIGFIYQFHHLLPEFTAEENIVMPQLFLGVKQTRAQKRAQELMEFLGIGPRGGHLPAFSMRSISLFVPVAWQPSSQHTTINWLNVWTAW